MFEITDVFAGSLLIQRTHAIVSKTYVALSRLLHGSKEEVGNILSLHMSREMGETLVKFLLNNVVRKLYLVALPRQYEVNRKAPNPGIKHVA
jgi:hypothetical protein